MIQHHTNLIVADNNYFRFYLESLQALVRIQDTNSDVGKLGFQTLKYMNADVVLDGGIYTGSYTGVPTSQMYFLNTKYIHYRPHSDRNMVVDERPRVSVNQDAEARLILWAGNMTLSNAFVQGVLSA